MHLGTLRQGAHQSTSAPENKQVLSKEGRSPKLAEPVPHSPSWGNKEPGQIHTWAGTHEPEKIYGSVAGLRNELSKPSGWDRDK